MRTFVFAQRVVKEVVRDRLSLFFGLVFPIILLFLLSAINNSIPVDLFSIESLTPGIIVFGLSFMALFSAQVLAKDRSTSFLARLHTTPMTASNFIGGYMLPLLAMSIVQVIICLIAAMFLGLQLSGSMLLLLLFILPVAVIYISIGLICATLFSEKAAVAICGAVLTNVSAWFSGAWFDLNLVGGLFKDIAYALPFVHAVEMSKAVLNENIQNVFPHFIWVIAYSVLLIVAAIIIFNKKTPNS